MGAGGAGGKLLGWRRFAECTLSDTQTKAPMQALELVLKRCSVSLIKAAGLISARELASGGGAARRPGGGRLARSVRARFTACLSEVVGVCPPYAIASHEQSHK